MKEKILNLKKKFRANENLAYCSKKYVFNGLKSLLKKLPFFTWPHNDNNSKPHCGEYSVWRDTSK